MSVAVAGLLVATAGTYLTRYASVRSFSNRSLDARVAAVLRHAALGIMASLVIASLPAGDGAPLTDVAALAGLGVGIVASRRLTNVSVVVALGVAGYALARAVGAALG